MNDVQFDEIKEIKVIERKHYHQKYVYDFSVKDNETFALSNGMFVHNTLNTFHMSGVASKCNVNQGVPRLRELISTTKNPATPSLTIFLKNMTSKEKVKQALNQVELISFDYFVQSTELYYDPMIYDRSSVIEEDAPFVKDYYEFFDTFHEDFDIKTLSPWLLRIKIHPLYLLSKSLTMLEIFNKIRNKINNMSKFNKQKIHIIYSDDNSENIVFHIRFSYPDIYKMDGETFITSNDSNKLHDLEKNLMDSFILLGVKGIKKVYIREIKTNYIKKNGEIGVQEEYILDTLGTNLIEVISLPFVDGVRTFSNDIHEMNEAFGVELTREILNSEITNIIKNNGIYVNARHINLLCDLMTSRGILHSIDRHGMNKSDAGPLTKTSFEEAESQISTASIFNLKDTMNSITSNIMMGQVGKYGSGFPEIMFDLDKFQKNIFKN